MQTDKRLNILHIITRLDKGGSADIVLSFAAHQAKQHSVTVISGKTVPKDQEYAQTIANQNGFKLIFIHNLVREISPVNDLLALIQLTKIIRQGNYDIVHTHTSKAGILGRWSAFLQRTINHQLSTLQVIHMPHGHIFYGYYGFFKTQLFIFLERFTALATDIIITLTKIGIEEHLKFKIAPREKFVAISNGIDEEKYLSLKIDIASKKKELGIPPESTVITTVARLEPVKGVKYLIESIPLITKSPNIPLTFLIVGDGSLRTELEQQSKIFDTKTIFLGERNDVPEILAISDIFVLPSIMEGFGIVLLEAMIFGKPVIATSVGGVPEIVIDGESGILVPSANPEKLAEAISRVLKDNSLRHKLGENGKQRVLTNYTQNRMLTDLDQLVYSITKQN